MFPSYRTSVASGPHVTRLATSHSSRAVCQVVILTLAGSCCCQSHSCVSTQVSGLYAEEADGEPEGAVLRGGALLQGVHRSDPEEPGENGGGRLHLQPAQQLLEREAAKYDFQMSSIQFSGDSWRLTVSPSRFPAMLLAEEGMLYRARYFGDGDLYQRAQRARTPSCAKLSEITASING